VKQAEAAAKTLGINLKLIKARSPDDFESAFATMDKERTRAVNFAGPLVIINF
jgi:hypothetical protein